MNERIRELAEQAGLDIDDSLAIEPEPTYYGTQSDFEKFAELVRADEREACAKLCDDWPNGRDDVYSIGQAIRARGKQEPVDWEAVAADQAMTIAMMKIENKREWVGLTEEEIKKIAKKHKWHEGNVEPHLMPVFRSLEAKLKEKNGG